MTRGIRHDDLRRNNRAMVLAAVRRAGRLSRTEIAGLTGFSHSTISAISGGLIEEGALCETARSEEADPLLSRRGRPQIGIALAPQAASVIVMTLVLNHLSAALIDYAGNIVDEDGTALDTLSASREQLGAAVLQAGERILEKAQAAKAGPVRRIVLAVQGITDKPGRALVWSPITSSTEVNFAGLMEDRFSIPTIVENDCSMIAAALQAREPRRHDDFAAVLLSHGIGMGMMLGGTLFSGTRSSGAEFGHMIHRPGGALCRCGKRGCVEAYAGSYAIWRNGTGNSEDAPPASQIPRDAIARLTEAARNGGTRERKALDQAGEALGTALGSLFALVDPLPVTFVGSGTVAFDLIKPGVRRGLASTAGGSRAGNIVLRVEADEMPLIQRGSAARALNFLDAELFSSGATVQPVA